jgi:Fanconi anemia group M protein
MARLIADSRESTSGLIQLLTNRGAEVVLEELECADYVLADGIAVERKTAEDFAGSIIDRRLFVQIALLKDTYEKVFIVVEGDPFDTQSSISHEAIFGALSYISVIERIPVISTRDAPHTAEMLLTMQRHAVQGLGYEVAFRASKPRSRAVRAQFLIEGLPGIGPTAAKRLLKHFGSAGAIFSATPEQLKKVPGVGPKTIQAIREVLDHQVSFGQVASSL